MILQQVNKVTACCTTVYICGVYECLLEYVHVCVCVCVYMHVCMACVTSVCVNSELNYRRLGFNCVVKQLRFWLFKVDCEFKDCDLRVLCIGHTCVIYTLRSNNCELREKSQFAIIKLRN